MTALTVEQVLGICIGVGGLAATWWLSIKRNQREAERREDEHEEHELRMDLIRNRPDRRETI